MRLRFITFQEAQDWLISQLSELIGVAPQEIDPGEPFASYGLTSRDAISLSGDLREWLGREISPSIVYSYPDIASLAEHIAHDLMKEEPSPEGRQAARQNDFEPIAVIGVGCRFPSAENPESFWALLREGVDAITEVPLDRWDPQDFYDPTPGAPGKMSTRWGGFLNEVALFDADFFGVSPREAKRIDPQQRLLLEVSWEALENAGLAPEKLRGAKTGVFVGISTHDYNQLQMSDLLSIDAYAGTGGALSIAANRLSYFYDFRGPSLAVDTACSSSLVATHLACQSLRSGESDLALAGGVNLILTPELSVSFSHARMMASDGRCKAFDDRADGYVRGEGCGLVVLKRLSQAINDGDTILAIVRGTAVNQDGRSNGLTAPNGAAQEAVIHQALMNAGLNPAQISYVEAHGTGTSLGDPIEFDSLKAVLMKQRAPNQPCLLGSVKTNIGHLEAAAGIAGLIKTILSLWRDEIPPVLHFKQRNPHISLEGTTFHIPTKAHSWPEGEGSRFAGVSSFGFGGVNAHAILESAPDPAPIEDATGRYAGLSIPPAKIEEAPASRPQAEPECSVLCLSARSTESLRLLAGRYADYLHKHSDQSLADLCYTANTGRTGFAHRMMALSRSNAELSQQLKAYSEEGTTPGIFSGQVNGRRRPRIAFLCSGGGSQYIGMGKDLYDTHPIFRQTLEQCDQILRDELERPLLKAIYPSAGDESLLDQMAYTQPALFAFEYALAQVWRAYGVEAEAVMGHSTGEYVAACLAGVFSLEEGLKLVAARGRLMQGLPEGGAMAAVSGSLKQVAPILDGYEKEVSVAAINGPSQVVISGQKHAVKDVCDKLAGAGVESQYLLIPHASHSPLVEPMMEEFGRLTGDTKFATPRLTLISNVTGKAIESGEDLRGKYWSLHLRQPVQFASGMDSLRREGYEIFVELGPGTTLVGLGRNCLGEEGVTWAPSLKKERKDWEQLHESLGRLWVSGVDVNWKEATGGARRRLAGLPNYPFQRKRHWLNSAESNNRRMVASAGKSDAGSGHPLLGYRLRSAVPERQFESQLSVEALPFLSDHQICGMTVAPATAYIEMALAAITAADSPNPSSLPILEELVIHKAMSVPQDETRIVQMILTPESAKLGSFQIFSMNGDHESASASWSLHASGRFHVQDVSEMSAAEALTQIQSRCCQDADTEAFYRRLNESGLNHWISFRCVEKLWRRGGEALAQIQLPESMASRGAKYWVHPALLDACFQTIAAALPDPKERALETGIYLPIKIESVQLYKPVDTRVWSHAVLRQAENNALNGDARIFDASGQIVAEVTGIRYEQVSREAFLESGASRQGAPDNWLYEISWQPKLHLVSAAVRKRGQSNDRGCWLILADQRGVGAGVAKLFEDRGDISLIVHPSTSDAPQAHNQYSVDPSHPEAFDRILGEIRRERHAPLRGIIHLWSLDAAAPEELTSSALEQAQTLSCASVLHLTQALSRCGFEQSPRLWLVTRGAQAVGTDPGPLSVAQTPIWGFGRVITWERPDLNCVQVDLDPSSNVNDTPLLFEEICLPEEEDQIAFRDGVRYVARLVHRDKNLHETGRRGSQPTPFSRLAVSGEGSYLITGGIGALGLQIAKWLVSRGARNLLLVSRRPPGAAAAEKLRALKTAGANIVMAQADVGCADRLAAALSQAGAGMPPLRGVIHAAGVLSDGLLSQQKWSQFAEVMSSKVTGAWNLQQYVEGRELDFFVMCSSAASVLGSPGQANYAAANAFLDGLAFYRRSRGETGVSVNWGPWAGDGLAAGAGTRRWAELGIKLIDPEHGAELLSEALEKGSAQVVVVGADWKRVTEQYGGRAPALLREVAAIPGKHAERVKRGERFRKILMSSASDGSRDKWEHLVNYLQEEVAATLGLDGRHSIDVRKNMSELGLDSLMALELRNTLGSVLGITLPATLIFDHPSIELLARYLGEKALALVLPEDARAEKSEDENQVNLTDILARLDNLSETEAEKLLGRELFRLGN
jgi:acyl transferase domain-containing protein/acyl carrier protein